MLKQVEHVAGVLPAAHPRLRGRWAVIVVVATYVFATAAIAMLFWVLPRAGAARDLSFRSAALSSSVVSLQADIQAAQASVARLNQRLADARSDLSVLKDTDHVNRLTIKRLQARIAELEAERAAAAARLAAATTAPAAVVPVGPPTFCVTWVEISPGTISPTSCNS
ncbi:MAG TPA: hypothetical protein VKA30_06375 [Actinomycetota bacterium]|nr:hypothetical protein [Actinomycetota bacterium]